MITWRELVVVETIGCALFAAMKWANSLTDSLMNVDSVTYAIEHYPQPHSLHSYIASAITVLFSLWCGGMIMAPFCMMLHGNSRKEQSI
jgi:hypothetical protein